MKECQVRLLKYQCVARKLCVATLIVFSVCAAGIAGEKGCYMDVGVFISWSGERSRQIAEALKPWLRGVIQSVQPWMSDEDISAGSRWFTEVTETLNKTKIGVLCVTPENQHNPWLMYEAGALSRVMGKTAVCPLLFDMTPAELNGPLAQFQASVLSRDGVGKLVTTLNRYIGERALDSNQLETALNVWWPQLYDKVNNISPPAAPKSVRPVEDQLQEILTLLNENIRREIRVVAGTNEFLSVPALNTTRQ
jgi:hypothetical protein